MKLVFPIERRERIGDRVEGRSHVGDMVVRAVNRLGRDKASQRDLDARHGGHGFGGRNAGLI
jgi:hypothetical protein